MFQTLFERSTLHDIGEYVVRRVDEEIRRADEAGDKPALSYALGTRELVAAMRRDIDARPWARHEVANYLLRTARLYRGHPDYREWWG